MSEPVISYPPELPVSAAREEIARAIRDHQVVIVAGATGSGKTTQLPKICLELGRERIAHTQPRRLAARTIAERVAEELQVRLGELVGYKVRFTDQVSDATRVALMTDGILLNEVHRDRLLRRYDTIIIDEAHERSLNVDFLLGYLRQILPERPELRVIVTSATIDPQSFAAHFAEPSGEPAPIIEVSGRSYPVEIRYRPLSLPSRDTEESTRNGRSPAEPEDEVSAIVAALRELDKESPGDVLVFLPGEAEIRDAADAVRGAYAKDSRPVEVLPLYGRLSASEQHRVFEPSRVAGVRRRVILATNVAETSLTVPGIRYVIDTGTARISRYSARSKVQRLPIEAISQASANQRSGRAGRQSAGIAIRLYEEEDFERRAEFTEPEILRTSLAAVTLQMLALGFGELADFPFLTPPESRDVRAAFDLLIELGAITQSRQGEAQLTRIGREIARMPIDPRFARMLLAAQHPGAGATVLPEVLAIVAGLSIQDVRERPSAEASEATRQEAERMHARFTDPTSDFLALLKLWKHLREKQKELGSSAFRRMCRAEHLNYVRVREWFDVYRQLRSLVPKDAAGRSAGDADPDAIHRALLSGLLSHIGILDERTVKSSGQGRGDKRRVAEYRGARGIRFSIFPGSGLRKKSPTAVMAAEIVETSRTFARTVAIIDPAWAEPLAQDLAHRQVSEPHWSKDAGAAIAYEKVTLFGVEIVARRRVQFARIDRAASRELFLRHALVEGDWDPARLGTALSGFWRSNTELRRRLERLEERERRRDILAGDETIYRFYDARIPNEIFDVRSFEAWWRDAVTRSPRLLTMRESDLVERADRAEAGEFPSRWVQGEQQLSLAYRFEPGAIDDGVSVVVPLALLAQIEDRGFDWQVPGLRPELIAALLRALPKAIRRHVVPAADWAEKLGAQLAGHGPEDAAGTPERSLREALARLIQPLANQAVTAEDFEIDRVPGHLRVNFRVVDERGRVLGSGRDLRALQAQLSEHARTAVSRSLSKSEQGMRAAMHESVTASAPAPSGADSQRDPARGDRGASASIERDDITTWDFGELPPVLDTRVAGGVVRGFPALVDRGKSVSIRVEATADAAERATREGVLRLVLLGIPSPAPYVQEHLSSAEKLALASSPYASTAALIEDCRRVVTQAVIDDASSGVIRSESEFQRVREMVSGVIVDEIFSCVSLVASVLTAARAVERGIRAQNSHALLGPLGDIKAQLSGLIFPGFVSATGRERLAQYPRYLDGILERLAALPDAPGKDRARQSEFEQMSAAYAEAGGTIPLAADAPAALVTVRWLLEEYRVSLFAQRLGTARPVSPQRIRKELEALRETRRA